MKNQKSTRRALVTSVLSLILCLSMLIGTTFAWFTDSVTSANNKIQAGNLDVDLYMWTDADTSTEITNESAPIFGVTDQLAQDNAVNTLWEPGKTQVVYLSIKNNGSLDLKYKVALDVTNPTDGKDLYKAMRYAIANDAKFGAVTAWDNVNAKAVVPGINSTQANDVALKAGQEHFFALSVHMIEEAGNEYQGGQVMFDLKVLAGQLASEKDSFGNDYDALAIYPSFPGFGSASAPKGDETAATIEIRNENGTKVGSAVIPADAVAAGASTNDAAIVEVPVDGNFTIADGMEAKSFNISVTGLKENNTTPVKVAVRMPEGKDPATFKLYHYNTEIPCTYDPTDGYVTFETATFSPFTIVYDADSVYVPPVVDEEGSDLPKATVVEKALADTPGYSTDPEVKWGQYGAWSPNTEIDADPKLEAAYVFTCTETLEQAKANPYANWHCDFYVKLDKDLGANQIFLGGNYGSFGWVGFHNGEVTLKANEEIPLLGSVTSNPWTYLDVVQFVGEFTCGVGDVDDALKGATFTVMLRLTNPDDATDFHNVATIEYTFK